MPDLIRHDGFFEAPYSSNDSAASAPVGNFMLKRQLVTATSKQAIVAAEVTDKLEMLTETRFVQHPPGVAADWKIRPVSMS